MSAAPAVSVVVATYNRAYLLPETIDSILRQKFQDFELIVVDDGSTDGTRAVVERYGPRVRYLCQDNRGPSAARNLGVKHARASWISFQDSDDLCAAEHLEALYGYARAHPECGMVFANGAYLAGKEHHRDTIVPREKSRRLARDGVRLIDQFDKSVVRLQAALISKRCYEAIGGHDESLWVCMDLDLSFRLFMNFPVAYLDRVVFFYRRHAGNISRNEERRTLENIRAIEKLLNDYPQARQLLGQKRIDRRLAYRYYRLAKGRWRRGEHDRAREALRAALALQPWALKYRLYQWRWEWSGRTAARHAV
ncbi:MAG TPA: glycosyltransferase [Methylomirabilota bacterium]|jgi:glycosyltransferase involved in cell wall biosynthesis|nr:glycosyltransferase [Methylomirabilota bacterium]